MNRLQKKCVIGTVGIHLLLLLILIVGPAFYNQPKTDDTQVLDVIPSNLIDADANSGVQGAQPPAPKPVTPQQPQQLFAPPKIVQPPTPAPAPAPAPAPREPSPSLLQEFKNYFTSKPEPTPTVKPDLTPDKRQTENTQPKIQINLTKVSRNAVKNTEQENNAQNQQAINKELKNLKNSLSSATIVGMPGHSSAAYASYKDALATIYYNAWTTPENATSDAAITKVRITVAKDGTVLNSEIITPSGDTAVDDSVRQALDSVSSVPPLPDQTKDQQEFTINFNLKTKRMFE